MSTTVQEKARAYYPALWPLARLEALVEAGKLTRAELDAVVGQPDVGDTEKGQGDIV